MGLGRKLTLEIVRKEFEDTGRKLLATEYINAKTKMPYVCHCGHKSEINYSNFKSGKNCKQCRIRRSSEARKTPYKEVYELFKNNGCELLEEEYIRADIPLRYVCVCGRESTVRYDNFKQGARCRQCYVDRITGPGSYLYKPWLTEEDREVGRNDYKLREWRKKVYERDDYTCRYCGRKGKGDLNAHHICGYAAYPELRYEVENGATLCSECHHDFHKKYGYREFYDFSFGDWLLMKEGPEYIPEMFGEEGLGSYLPSTIRNHRAFIAR